jgi:hypothetical protein
MPRLDSPFLVAFIVLGVVWLIGAGSERFKDTAAAGAALSFIVLALLSLVSFLQ